MQVLMHTAMFIIPSLVLAVYSNGTEAIGPKEVTTSLLEAVGHNLDIPLACRIQILLQLDLLIYIEVAVLMVVGLHLFFDGLAQIGLK